METSTLFSTSSCRPSHLALVAVKYSHVRAAAGEGRVDGSAREAQKESFPRQGGVARGSSTPKHGLLGSSAAQKEAGDWKSRRALRALAHAQPGVSRAQRCHCTSRDPCAGLVLQEASRGVLIKGLNKTDLPAYQKKCPPGK